MMRTVMTERWIVSSFESYQKNQCPYHLLDPFCLLSDYYCLQSNLCLLVLLRLYCYLLHSSIYSHPYTWFHYFYPVFVVQKQWNFCLPWQRTFQTHRCYCHQLFSHLHFLLFWPLSLACLSLYLFIKVINVSKNILGCSNTYLCPRW